MGFSHMQKKKKRLAKKKKEEREKATLRSRGDKLTRSWSVWDWPITFFF
jgi:hypothetical protein